MSGIQSQHLYWVNFNPIRSGEFPDHHLSIVLGINADGRTCRVIPLTRNSSGLGRNKICLNRLHTFTDISYAVIDQVRTVAFTRMSQHIDTTSGDPVDIRVPDSVFFTIKSAIM